MSVRGTGALLLWRVPLLLHERLPFTRRKSEGDNRMWACGHITQQSDENTRSLMSCLLLLLYLVVSLIAPTAHNMCLSEIRQQCNRQACLHLLQHHHVGCALSNTTWCVHIRVGCCCCIPTFNRLSCTYCTSFLCRRQSG